MLKYIVRRGIFSILTIFILITVTFFLMKMLPEGLFADPRLSAEQIQALRDLYGLDDPVIIQYFRYIGNLIHLDLGESMAYPGRNIMNMVFGPNGAGLLTSMRLGFSALIFSILVGISLGVVAALNQGKAMDKLTIIIALIGVAVPSFVLAPLLVNLFGIKLGWLPVTGFSTIPEMILPTFCLGIGTIATLSRISRTSMIEVVNADYVRTAKSKGLKKSRIIFKHQLRNAMLPVITVLGPISATLLTGTFVVEAVFNIQGLGYFFVQAVSGRDYLLALGLTIIYGTFLVTANFIVDIIYGYIDPRIRLVK